RATLGPRLLRSPRTSAPSFLPLRRLRAGNPRRNTLFLPCACSLRTGEGRRGLKPHRRVSSTPSLPPPWPNCGHRGGRGEGSITITSTVVSNVFDFGRSSSKRLRMSTGVVLDLRYMQHDTGRAHPERPERIAVLAESIRARGDLETVAPRLASLD